MEANFREWLKKNYGRQDYNAYANTQTEELAIQYLLSYKASLTEAIEKEMEPLSEKKHPRTLEAYRNVLELIDTVNPKN